MYGNFDNGTIYDEPVEYNYKEPKYHDYASELKNIVTDFLHLLIDLETKKTTSDSSSKEIYEIAKENYFALLKKWDRIEKNFDAIQDENFDAIQDVRTMCLLIRTMCISHLEKAQNDAIKN